MIYSEKIKIGIKDIVKDNIVGNKAILEYFENIAGHHADSLGYGINSTNLNWVLLEWNVKLIKEVEGGQTLTVNTWSRSMDRCYGNRDFEIYNEKNELCVVATSKWLLIDTEKKKITKATQEMMDKYDSEKDRRVFDEELGKIEIPNNFQNSITYKVIRRDIDIIGHMHNLYYLDLAYEALPEEVYKRKIFNNIRITYKKEIKLGDNVRCKYSFVEDKHIVVIENEDGSILHSIIEIS